MRLTSSLLFVAALGLAAGLQVPAAQAGGLVVGIAAPVAVAAPVIAVPPVAVQPAAVAAIPIAPVTVVTDDYDPAVIVDGYCCSPGWHDGRHSYGWRNGYRGYARTAYEHPAYERRGYARPVNAPVARGREAVRSGRR
jgi:hypothetical protein